MNWRDITYLKAGNPRQQAAYQALVVTGIFDVLAQYNPILVGTIPIAIDLPESDLDIACQATNLDDFDALIQQHYGNYDEFIHWRNKRGEGDFTVSRFITEGFEFEIYAEDKPTVKQNAYRHMVIEHHLLQIGGEAARHAIIARKQQGLKTEPAFAQYFNIRGSNPYDDLLKLEPLLQQHDNETLRKLLKIDS